MSELKVNDLFDDLFHENKRLINELVFATKYFNVMNKFKAFVDLILDKIKTNLDPNIIKIYEELGQEVDNTWNSWYGFGDKQLTDQRVNGFSDTNSNHESIEVKPDIFVPDQSMDTFAEESNDSFYSVLSNNETTTDCHSKTINQSFDQNISQTNSKAIDSQSVDKHNEQIDSQSKDLKNGSKTKDLSIIGNDFKCIFDGCPKVFDTQTKLVGHQKRCHSGQWFVCNRPECQYKTRTKSLIKFHENNHSLDETYKKSESFVCDFQGCVGRFSDRGDFRRHMSQHKANKSFVCEYESCYKKFKSKDLLERHIKECHLTTQQTFRCDLKSCDKSFQTYELMAKHMSFHNMDKHFECKYSDCEFKIRNLKSLRKHMKVVHKIDRPFKCMADGCLFSTETISALQLHNKTVHLNGELYLCDRRGCAKIFKSQASLNAHYNNFHSDLIFDCDWPGCQFFAKSKTCLKSHERSHENERQYACDWKGCDKRFNFKHKLTLHMRTHTQEKRYVCNWPDCQYRCIFGGNLRKHMRVHQK